MLKNLMESAPAGQVLGGRLAGSVISLTIHTGLIFGAVLGTMKPDEVTNYSPDSTEMIFIDHPQEEDTPPPKALERPPPVVRRTLVAPIGVPSGIPPVDLTQTFDLNDFDGFDGVEGDWFDVDEGSPGDSVPVFSVAVVDEAPVRISSPPLEYPRVMERSGIVGVVLVQAVVDSTGRVEAGSVQVIQSSQSAFEGPAKRLVLRSLFQPARVRGRAVRVLIQIPVQFSLVSNG